MNLTSEKPIPDRMFFRIGDVADLVGVKPYVLRYWETEFSIVSPGKSAKGQRKYRRADVELLLLIKHLLYKERYSIEGARKRIQELRKEGNLKNVRQGKHSTRVDTESALERKEKTKQLLSICKELRSLARMPVRELFKY